MEQLLLNKGRRVEKNVSPPSKLKPKLKEFHFKFMHRIIVSRRELFRYGIQPDDDCIYCGEKDSIDHTFTDCVFVKKFSQEVISWFNVTNRTHFNPSIEEKLFGVTSESYGKKYNEEIRCFS